MGRLVDFTRCNTMTQAVEHHDWLLQYDPDHKYLPEFDRDNILREYAGRCRVIKELGVYQGASLIKMLLQPSVEHYIGVDISTQLYDDSLRRLVDVYCEQTGKRVDIIRRSSTDPSTVSPCDMLHIDSLHNAGHLLNELNVHASSVSKYIAFHDVNQNNRALFKAVMKFTTTVQPDTWKTAIDYDRGKAGCLVIERTG